MPSCVHVDLAEHIGKEAFDVNNEVRDENQATDNNEDAGDEMRVADDSRTACFFLCKYRENCSPGELIEFDSLLPEWSVAEQKSSVGETHD